MWLRFPYELSGGESSVALAVLRIGQQPLIYQKLVGLPLFYPYTPLFAYLSFPLFVRFGSVYFAGRTVTLVSFLLSMFVLYRIFRLRQCKRLVAWIFAILPLSVSLIRGHAYFMQSDLTAILFNLAGIFFFSRWAQDKGVQRRPVDFILALLFFSCAVFTKQNYIFAAMACMVYLLLRRSWKECLCFALCQAAFVVVPMFALNFATRGAFFQNIFVSHINGYHWFTLAEAWRLCPTVEGLWPLYLLSLIFFVLRVAAGDWNLLVIYFLTTAASTLLVGKTGSHHHYFIEFTYACVLLLGGMMTFPFSKAAAALLRTALWAVVLVRVVTSALEIMDNVRTQPGEAARRVAQLVPVNRLLSQIHGPVISENTGLLIANGKPVIYQMHDLSLMAHSGHWDPKYFLNQLDSQVYPVIIVSQDFLGWRGRAQYFPGFLKSLMASYAVRGALADYIFLVPKSSVAAIEKMSDRNRRERSGGVL